MQTAPPTDCLWIPCPPQGRTLLSHTPRDSRYSTAWGYFTLQNDSLALLHNLEFGRKLCAAVLTSFPGRVDAVRPVELRYLTRVRVRLMQWLDRFFVATCLQPNPGLSVGGLVFGWYMLLSIFWGEVEAHRRGPLHSQQRNATLHALAPQTTCPELGIHVYVVRLQHQLAPPRPGVGPGPRGRHAVWLHDWHDRACALWRQCAPLLLPRRRLEQLSWNVPGSPRGASNSPTPSGSTALLLDKVARVGFWVESQLAVLDQHAVVASATQRCHGYVTQFYAWVALGVAREPDSSVDQHFRNLCYSHHLGACTLQAYLRKNPVQSVHTPMVTVMNDTLHPEHIHQIQRAASGAGVAAVCTNHRHPCHDLGLLSWFQHWFKLQFRADWAKSYLVHGYTWLENAPVLRQATRQQRTRRPVVVYLLDRWFVQVCVRPPVLVPAATTAHALVVWLLFTYHYFGAELESGGEPMFAQIETICGLGSTRSTNQDSLRRLFQPVLTVLRK
jgi:hypothetical protein